MDGTIRLVCSDGTIRIMRKPIRASPIMEEFPQLLLYHSDSFYIGQRTAALSDNKELKMGNRCVLLPEMFFQPELMLLSLASLLSSPSTATGTAAHLRSIEHASAFCQPFEIQSSGMGLGGSGIKVSTDFIMKLMEEKKVNKHERGQAMETDSAYGKPGLCNTPELQKDYEKLVISRDKCWRPKLWTIKEKEKNGIFKTRLRQT